MKSLGNHCSKFNLCFHYRCCSVSDKHSLTWQKMTLFSTKCPCIIICSAQTHALQCGKMIMTLQNVSQLLGCILWREESKPVLTILWVFTACKTFSCVKYGLSIAPQPTWALGLAIRRDNIVSESFITNYRQKNMIALVCCPPGFIQET